MGPARSQGVVRETAGIGYEAPGDSLHSGLLELLRQSVEISVG